MLPLPKPTVSSRTCSNEAVRGPDGGPQGIVCRIIPPCASAQSFGWWVNMQRGQPHARVGLVVSTAGGSSGGVTCGPVAEVVSGGGEVVDGRVRSVVLHGFNTVVA